MTKSYPPAEDRYGAASDEQMSKSPILNSSVAISSAFRSFEHSGIFSSFGFRISSFFACVAHHTLPSNSAPLNSLQPPKFRGRVKNNLCACQQKSDHFLLELRKEIARMTEDGTRLTACPTPDSVIGVVAADAAIARVAASANP